MGKQNTEFVDKIQVSCPSSEDYLKTREWKHKEYITKELLSLKEMMIIKSGYRKEKACA